MGPPQTTPGTGADRQGLGGPARVEGAEPPDPRAASLALTGWAELSAVCPDAGWGRAPGAPGSTRLLRPRARPCRVWPWTGPRGWRCAPCLTGCQTVPRRCPPDRGVSGGGGVSTRSGAAPGTGARATARPPCARGRQGGGPGVGMSGDVVSTVRGARSGVRSRPAHVRRGPDVGRRFVVIVWSQPLEVAAAAGAPGTRASVPRKASTKAQPRCEASALWAPLSGKSLETGTRHVGGSSFPRHSWVLGLVLPPPGRPPPAAGVSSWLVVTPTAPSGCVCLHLPQAALPFPAAPPRPDVWGRDSGQGLSVLNTWP